MDNGNWSCGATCRNGKRVSSRTSMCKRWVFRAHQTGIFLFPSSRTVLRRHLFRRRCLPAGFADSDTFPVEAGEGSSPLVGVNSRSELVTHLPFAHLVYLRRIPQLGCDSNGRADIPHPHPPTIFDQTSRTTDQVRWALLRSSSSQRWYGPQKRLHVERSAVIACMRP